MPNYANTLHVNFNVLDKPCLEVLDEIPIPTEIIQGLSLEKAQRRDGWVFMVRKEGILRPYYFDYQEMEVFPFGGSLAMPGEPVIINIGDNIAKEFVVQHNRDTFGVVGLVYMNTTTSRKYLISCDLFLVSRNELGFEFSETPANNEFIVVIGALI
jgi:hypothetical protein